jgi:hypothetical protein
MEEMCGAIKGLGVELGDIELPYLGPCEISSGEDDDLSSEKLETGDKE